MQKSPDAKDMNVVNSSCGDMGPKSAAQVNPDPDKKGQQSLTKTKMHGAFKLIALSCGQLFGDDDIYNKRPRFATATCVSQTGFVWEINGNEFKSLIEKVDESRIEVKKQLYTKQMQIKERLEMIE